MGEGLFGFRGEKDPDIIGKENESQYVGSDETHKVGKSLTIDAVEAITLVCGSSPIVMKLETIIIDSPKLQLNPCAGGQ